MSNLQVPTTSESPWGKVNVSKFMDFGEFHLEGKNVVMFSTIKKNNCYMKNRINDLQTPLLLWLSSRKNWRKCGELISCNAYNHDKNTMEN